MFSSRREDYPIHGITREGRGQSDGSSGNGWRNSHGTDLSRQAFQPCPRRDDNRNAVVLREPCQLEPRN